MEHGDEEIGEGVVALGVEGEVLAVLEAAAREESREVRRHVCVRVPEIGPVEDHRPVEQRVVVLLHALQLGEEIIQQPHVPLIDRAQLSELRLVAAMMREVVIPVGDLGALDVDRG